VTQAAFDHPKLNQTFNNNKLKKSYVKEEILSFRDKYYYNLINDSKFTYKKDLQK